MRKRMLSLLLVLALLAGLVPLGAGAVTVKKGNAVRVYTVTVTKS